MHHGHLLGYSSTASGLVGVSACDVRPWLSEAAPWQPDLYWDNPRWDTRYLHQCVVRTPTWAKSRLEGNSVKFSIVKGRSKGVPENWAQAHQIMKMGITQDVRDNYITPLGVWITNEHWLLWNQPGLTLQISVLPQICFLFISSYKSWLLLLVSLATDTCHARDRGWRRIFVPREPCSGFWSIRLGKL